MALPTIRQAIARYTPARRSLFLFLLLFKSSAGISAFGASAIPAYAAFRHPAVESNQSGSNSDDRLELLISQAQQAQDRRDFSGAVASYQEVLKLRPHFAEARANLGLMYHLLGDYHSAVGQFQLALRDQPELLVPNLFLGLDLLELHEPQKALVYLQRAHRMNTKDQPTTLGLGRAYSELREFEPANDWYFRAVEMNPADSQALYGLGITYLDLQKAAATELGSKGRESLFSKRLLADFFEQEGRIDDAINLYKKLLESNTTWTGLRTSLGFDYVQQGDIAEATAEFRAELEPNRGFLLARLGLARTSFEQGDFGQCSRALTDLWATDRTFFRANSGVFLVDLSAEKARELRERLSENASSALDPDLRSYLTGRLQELPGGQMDGSPVPSPEEKHAADQVPSPRKESPSALYQQGEYSLCAQYLRQAKDLDRDHLLLLSQCSYYSGDYRTSFLASGKALTTKPSDFEALYWRVASSSRLAVQALYAAGLADPNSYRVHLMLAEAYRMMKKYQAAGSEYGKALDLKPDDPAVHLGLATLLWETKDYDKAVPELREVLSARPNDPEASYLMGDILVARRQYSEAEPYLAAALGATGSTVCLAHALRGKILASQDRTAEAIKEFQLALPGDSDGSFHFQIYKLYTRVGNQQAAAAALRESEAIRQQQANDLQAALERNE